MELYKGTICSIILGGVLNEAPVIYKTTAGKEIAEFFLTIYSSNDMEIDKFFLHKIIVKNSEVLKIKNYAQPGLQLFVEGNLADYHVMQSSEKNFVIVEINANRLWFTTPPKTTEFEWIHMNQYGPSRYFFDITKSNYVH